MTTMLKLLRNICIWMCSTSCLFGYVTHAVPLEYFDDHEFSYDMDTAQSKVKYDPRLLSQQLKDQHNHPQERAAPCYSATNKYTHGQRVSREDPCEVCLCVDGEIFCWWKKCGSPKRRKFKLEKNTKLGKSKKDKTAIDRINKEQLHKEQLHLKQKKKLEKKLRQQHWQEQQHQLQQQHTGARSKILTFPENLPSVLYYDYKTEDQHGFQHGNHEKPPAPPADGSGGVVGRTDAHAHTSISGSSREDDDNNNNDGEDDDDDDDASSAVGVVQPTSTEMKFGAKSHSATESSKKISLQQPSTARITTTTTTTTTTKAAVATAAAASQSFPNDYTKEERLTANNQFISGHPVGGMQMLNIDSSRHHTTERTKNHTTTEGETTFMLSQEVDHDDGILRGTGGGSGGSVSTHGSKYSTSDNNNGKQNDEQLKGGATSFRSSFNDFSSEFNASAAVDLDLIMGHHSSHDAPIILEADSIANASSSSSSLLAKHEATGDSASNANTNNNRYNLILSTTMVTSTTVNQDQECIVMGSSYKIGAILPQETGNCLQCICIEGATKDDTPRVTCSPHNCPPLVLPDLFDATGY